MTIASVADPRGDWRRHMRGELFWILVVKLGALTLLWLLFFSAAHRQPVDGKSVGRRLGIAPAVIPPPKEISGG